MRVCNLNALKVLHVNLCFEKLMEEYCLNVKLNNDLVVLCGNIKYYSNGFILQNRIKDLIIIYFIFLDVVFCNKAHLKFCKISIKI